MDGCSLVRCILDLKNTVHIFILEAEKQIAGIVKSILN